MSAEFNNSANEINLPINDVTNKSMLDELEAYYSKVRTALSRNCKYWFL